MASFCFAEEFTSGRDKVLYCSYLCLLDMEKKGKWNSTICISDRLWRMQTGAHCWHPASFPIPFLMRILKWMHLALPALYRFLFWSGLWLLGIYLHFPAPPPSTPPSHFLVCLNQWPFKPLLHYVCKLKLPFVNSLYFGVCIWSVLYLHSLFYLFFILIFLRSQSFGFLIDSWAKDCLHPNSHSDFR